MYSQPHTFTAYELDGEISFVRICLSKRRKVAKSLKTEANLWKEYNIVINKIKVLISEVSISLCVKNLEVVIGRVGSGRV
jgi:hypothetical protein